MLYFAIMTTKINSLFHSDTQPDLRRFTLDFFSAFGSAATPLNETRHSPLRVVLGNEPAAHFGRSELLLRFQQGEGADGHELVAYGSRIFDQMIAYLDKRSAVTIQRLPARLTAGEELLKAVSPLNAAVVGLETKQTTRRLFLFTWHITYRADDKQEELYTVAVDEEGNYVPPRSGEGRIGWDWQTAWTDAQAVNGAEDEQAEAARLLPPMTHLVRHAEAAHKYAVYYADQRCANLETAGLARLHKVLSRLITYYEQQIDEVYDSNDPLMEQRDGLRADLQRKISEEIENHRLRVRVALSSYAMLEIPAATVVMTLQAGRQRAVVEAQRNLYDGVFTYPACHVCNQPATRIALDRGGHLLCEACVHTCAACSALLCEECGVAACPVCAAENCAACSVFCWACGERACADHVACCPTCGDTTCLACQQACAACGTEQCTGHLRRDAVADARGEVELICPACALRCPACLQFSAHIETCAASGQRFCLNCIVHCRACGKPVGPGFYHVDPAGGEPLCNDCLLYCAACNAIVAEEHACPQCGEACCAACGSACSVCDGLFCGKHVNMLDCGHAVCDEDLALCAMWDDFVCPICSPPCAICDQMHCPEHTASCHVCRLAYCTDCIDAKGICVTCARMEEEGVAVDMDSEPCIDHPAVAEIASFYKWQRVENRRYQIYRGKGLFLSTAIVTVEKTATGGRVIDAYEFDLKDLLRVRFWRK